MHEYFAETSWAPTREPVEKLHHLVHGACFIANSVKTEVRCEPVYQP